MAREAAGRRGRVGLAGGTGADGWTCSASRSGGPCPRPGWRPGSMRSWCPTWNRWWPITRWTSRSTRQLMLALYRGGRQADALAAYQRLRRTLDEELGIEPSQSLRDLELAILRQDSSLDAPAPAVTMLPGGPVPRLRRFRPSCRRRWRPSPDAAAELADLGRAAAAGGPERLRGPMPRSSCRRSRAPPGWARPRWPCTGRTGCASSSPTGSCTSNLRGFGRAGRRWIPARRCAGSWTRSRCRRNGSRPTWMPRSGCTAACSRASGCWWCWTTRGTPSRCARCCPARPDAWRW